MILKALYDYGVLFGPKSLAFVEDRVYWILDLDAKGNVHGLTFTGEKREKGAGYDYPRFSVPNTVEGWGKSRSSAVDPQYLLDNFTYLFGMQDKKGKGKRASQCAQAYRDRVQQVAARTGSAAAASLLKCVDRVAKDPGKVMKILSAPDGPPMYHSSGAAGSAPKHWSKSQTILVRVDGVPIFDCPEIRADWEAIYDASMGGELAQCMVTGLTAPMARLHRKVKVPGTEGPGAPLICFNERCFESFGMRGSENAPVSSEASERIAYAVDTLLKSERNRFGLPSGATALFWTGDEHQDDFLCKMLYGDAETVKDFYKAPYTGYQPDVDTDASQFHSLVIRGESGRISMRSILTMSHREVLDHLRGHYQDLDFEGLKYPLTIRSIIGAAYSAGSSNTAPGGAEEQLYFAAIAGERYPPGVLQALLDRCRRAPQGRSHEEKRSKQSKATRIAAAYGKAYINRAVRMGFMAPRKALEENMDKSNPSVPYRMGRLLAVLERLRRQAIPTSPPLSETALSMFMERPLLAFDTHYPRHVHHAHKLKGKGLWGKRLIGEIIGGIDIVPPRFCLEERAEVVIGYEHQKEDFYKRPEIDGDDESNE